MSKFSDHTTPHTDVLRYLPEVYQSDVNKSVFSNAFNRHFTKDDTQRISGYIGEGNPAALVDRKIRESTPHRQAYQLAPTMYSSTGTSETALSFTAFNKQLELMGVDVDRYPTWGNTTQFNWVPPVNLDMLINYANYFWAPDNAQDPAQYFTIENRFNKAQSKVNAYKNVLLQRGSEFSIVSIDFKNNAFIIDNKLDDLFVSGFVFYTKNSTNKNLQNKYWTVDTSTFDYETNRTQITVIEPIAPSGTTPPSDPIIGSWWFDTGFNAVRTWSASGWLPTVLAINVTISLNELTSVYQAESNCICNQDLGWDMGPWDDNQVGSVVWNTEMLANISHASYADWQATNNMSSYHPDAAPQPLDLWYDTANDVLKQRTLDNTNWVSVTSNFSSIIAATTGKTLWDKTLGCEVQKPTQWSDQNKWIHKSEVQSFTGIKRAEVPIFEYNSRIELNEWVKDVYGWKYRREIDASFADVESSPSRLELEPILGFVTVNKGGRWYVYLFDKLKSTTRDVDYTSTFVPGYQFRITNDELLSDVYTVETSEFRETSNSDPIVVRGEYSVTVLKLVETTYLSPTTGDNGNGTRIEPQQTSLGDVWRGYHAHWLLDTSRTSSYPCANQSWNLYYHKDINTTPTPIAHNDGEMYVGRAYQEITLSNDLVSVINLDESLVYDAFNVHHYAVADNDDLRVYVNGIRQYGNYRELVAKHTRPTYVGYAEYNATLQCVTGIEFKTPLRVSDIVRIEVGPAAQADMGTTATPVRTIEDEDEFLAALVVGTQPTYKSLHTYRRVEQVKTTTNQYPLFNVFDIVTGEVVKATNIFGFAESPTAGIHSVVSRRIIAASDNKEFEFEQSLLDVSNGLIYGYRSQSIISNVTDYTPTTWWYNQQLNKLMGWDENAWTSSAIVSIAGGILAFRTPVVSNTEPTHLNTLDSALWYNVSTNTVYRRNIVSQRWVSLGSATLGADPTLRTIWRKGTNNEQTVPQYVDSNKNPTVVGSPLGSWQIPDQWMYNPTHENRSNIKLSEMITHASTILGSQPALPGFLGGGLFTLTQDEFNYGVGGTIKEHNDGFDTLISAVNVSNVTPVGVMEFAQAEYASSLLFVRDLFTKSIVDLATNVSRNLTNFSTFVIDGVIDRYQTNEFKTQVYHDSSAYDKTTAVGVENWIATAPMFNLCKKVVPHVVTNGNTTEIFHHDGHRSQVVFSAAEEDRFARLIVSATDLRSEFGKLGTISTSTPPATTREFNSFFNPQNRSAQIHPGVYWYTIGGGIRQLYRLDCVSVAPVAPVGSFVNGSKFYNTVANAVFTKTDAGWVQSSPDYDLSSLWQPVVFKQLLAEVCLRIEQRLYDVTPSYTDAAFDYSSLTTTNNIQTYNNLYRSRFDAYVVSRNIRTPMVNDTYTATNPFTWNYVACVLNDPPRTGSATPAACWQAIYTNWFGTPYPHLEPWCLQGYESKPDWWETEYADTTGTRRWKYTHATKVGMWENIRVGRVPAGRAYPNGIVSTGNSSNDGVALRTYAYFCVNISDSTIAGGYVPDSILPPYYDNSATSQAMPSVRSLFTSFSSQIASPDADYSFTELGPVEWKWTTSMQYVYDMPIIAFLMQPVRFLHAVFGPQYFTVDGLQVETTFNKVYAHQDVLFHGDLYNTNETYTVRGLNQWYVNFNRYSGYDTNTHFRQEWAGWTPRLTYQFGGIIDTESFEISNKYFDINEQDYDITLINNGVISDVWVDAFEVSILSMPPSIIQYNNQGKWKFELDCLAAIPRDIHYYGVKSYAASPDLETGVATILQYTITGVTPTARRFFVSGDHTNSLRVGRSIEVTKSTANNGLYVIESVMYEPSTDRTRIVVAESIGSGAVNGLITIRGVGIGWDTGDTVVVSSSKILPAPLMPNTPYYLISAGVNKYQLAETYSDALAGVAITLTSAGVGDLIVSEISTSFKTFGGTGHSKETWFHYALDTNEVHTITPPTTINGMQSLINVIDGYVAWQSENGVLFGVAESGDFDPDTGRMVDWQCEMERCIEWAYRLRSTQVLVSDRFSVSANPTADTLTFLDSVPVWPAGTQVVVTTTGTLPTPLIGNTPYYVATTSVDGTIKLAVTANTTDESNIVDLIDAGSGNITIGLYNRQSVYPSFELNPTRNNIWVDTPVGVMSNIVEGPYSDIRVQQTIFDQYSRPLKSDKLMVYRDDRRSRVVVRPQLVNDVDLTKVNDQYNYIHFGGAHMFVEGYEHFVSMNDRTASDDLLFDPFYGIHAKKFNLDYYEKKEYTLRPNLGGYHLTDGKFEKNIEGTINNMRDFYDVMGLSQNSEMTKRAQSLVGYNGRSSYLDLLSVNSKSQFMFHRGMLQNKGSVNSVNAYINSRRFVDAKMDEFWAWKIAEFGDARVKTYPEVKLFATDGVRDDIRLLFMSPNDSAEDSFVIEDQALGFHPVAFSDNTRWVDFPEQRDAIITPLFLDAEITDMSVVYSGLIPPPATAIATHSIGFWYDGTTTRKYVNGTWVEVSGKVHAVDDVVYWKHDSICDTARVVRKVIPASTQYFPIVGSSTSSIVVNGNVTASFIAGTHFQITESTSDDGVVCCTSSQYSNGKTTIRVSGSLSGTTVGQALLLKYDFNNHETIKMIQGTGVNEFTIINAEVVRFDVSGFADILMIFTMNPAKSKISPAALLDKRSHTKLHDIPLWHPALGHHYHVARHNIDAIAATDPAKYTFTMNPSDASQQPWNSTETGYVWMDTGRLGYLPYYDDKIYPNVNDRLYQWGKLADWGDIRVFKWVDSTVPPAQWDARVLSDANDSSIVQNDKATGTPKKTTFRRTRKMYTVSSIDTVTDRITTPNMGIATGDLVLVNAGDNTLPGTLTLGTKYVAVGVFTDGNKQSFGLREYETDEDVAIPASAIQLYVCPAFKATDWVKYDTVRERILCSMVLDARTAITSPTFTLTNNVWEPGDVVDCHINGQYVCSGTISDSNAIQLPNLVVRECDIVDVVTPIHTVTDDELDFNPDADDDGVTLTQWTSEYEYTITATTSGTVSTGIRTTPHYHFWVESVTTTAAGTNSMSPADVASTIRNPQVPHFVVQRPMDDVTDLVSRYGYGVSKYGAVYNLSAVGDQYYLTPVVYRQAVLRNITSYVTDEDRFSVRFTRDLTLRDQLNPNPNYTALKNKHEEWFLFRKEQPSTVPTQLWAKLTEALMGQSLSTTIELSGMFGGAGYVDGVYNNVNMDGGSGTGMRATITVIRNQVVVCDITASGTGYAVDDVLTCTIPGGGAGFSVSIRSIPASRVPSLERELYDASYGTDTRFGLGVDQAFVDRSLGIASVVSYLQDPTNDFYPADIDDFFRRHSFSDPESIRSAMDEIYNTFPAEHTNAIWFETLHDAFSVRSHYKELMKTSWVALHGIRVLEVGGLFDE